MKRVTHILLSIALLIVSAGLTLGIGEAVVRMKNHSMRNYDVEMWRYANDLKIKSEDPALGFDHRHSISAVLQNVNIRLNNWGLRGPAVGPRSPGERRILFLGGSITLGWGVPEEDTIEARIADMFAKRDKQVEVLNGGVGNYNAERYVSRFFKELTRLAPTDIVVHYFLRDGEDLPQGGGNWALRHSELALTLWIAYNRQFDRTGEGSLVDHYRRVYEPDAHGFIVMKSQLKRLADYAKEHNIGLYLAMVPDVHNLIDYKFGFVHDIMRGVAQEYGYTYIDLLPALQGRPPEELWAMPGDPHPNAFGHNLMAEALFPILSNRPTAGTTTSTPQQDAHRHW